MSDAIADNNFLNQLNIIIEQNMANEQFGVSELADAMSMSRSNLLRKVKKHTSLSVSQLISQARLKRAMELLQTTSHNVSEISHQVGFNSTSYFIKCFREYYGYPPGEANKQQPVSPIPAPQSINSPFVPDPGAPNPVIPKSPTRRWLVLTIIILALVAGVWFYWTEASSLSPPLEKSIAVLPFKNDSGDSSNVYLINGLMESTLNNLQKIQDLKVISRTSAEKYRNNTRSIPEMARELNVNYFVEGSGQKLGDQILVNIQLIEGPTDRHLWSKQYRRQARDIFALQQEIARNIAAEIQAVITPEEQQRIEKKPTDNLEAYDHFLKGRELFFVKTQLPEALIEFNKAIALDSAFARAYADASLVYYYLDIFQVEKKYSNELIRYSDKALLYDPKLDESLVAKGLSYVYRADYKSAVLYLEKALEYNPNSGMAINFLCEFYNMHVPNTPRYLEYSLRGVQLEIGSRDSASLSLRYLHAANALIQAGFIDKALTHIDRSIAYNPYNPFSGFLRAYIRYARHHSMPQLKHEMIQEFTKDTTQFLVAQEVAKICYYTHDYNTAYKYYRKFIAFKNAQKLNIFQPEQLKIAYILNKLGYKKESSAYLENFKQFADTDHTTYKNLHLTAYHAYTGNETKALEHLRLFAKEDNLQYWVLLFENEPSIESIKDLPELTLLFKSIETKFWKKHDGLKESLEAKGLL